MKNLIFVLAFMLVGTFAFANNSVETELKIEKTVVETSDVLSTELNDLHNLTNNILDFFRRCKITHHVRDEEGNLMGTVIYHVETSGTCQEASSSLRELSNWIVQQY